MLQSPLVSIIIPCYNAQIFILKTIESVFAQSFQHFEIIIVDDGSTDNSINIIKGLNDNRIFYLKKENTGVSDSRNKGYEISRGDYILFLDSDDILANDFLEKKIQFLIQNPTYGFCSSRVIKINESGEEISGKSLKGAGFDLLREILSYNVEVVTCPSNYLFRKVILQEYAMLFDINLSSSADRFYFIQLSDFTTGAVLAEGGYLYYRVHDNSMSNNVTIPLLNDNLLFQKKVLELANIPTGLRREFRFKTNYIFAGSYFRLRKFIPFLFFSIKAFCNNPIGFIKRIVKL